MKDLVRIKVLVKNKYNIDLNIYNEHFLIQTIKSRMDKLGYQILNEYYTEISSDQEKIVELKKLLLVTYSAFFRDDANFAVLKNIVTHQIPTNVMPNKEIRIWSIGCSAGQEPYSISIIFEEYNRTAHRKLDYRIFATDISDVSLRKAKKGVYSKTEIEGLKMGYVKRYFNQIKGSYCVQDVLKKNIVFLNYDILDTSTKYPPESIYGDFDIIFCCNVLYYYHSSIQKQIIQKISNALKIKGYLVGGETERFLYDSCSLLKIVYPPSSVFSRIDNLE